MHTPPIALAVDFGDETFIADYLGQAPNYTQLHPKYTLVCGTGEQRSGGLLATGSGNVPGPFGP